ncbi:MAG: glycosyltransferase family A protein, partial [Pseudomonadota bacterium]
VDLASVIKRYGSQVRHHRQPSNGGLSHARNTGVQMARGEYVAFLDDDDAWAPSKLSEQIALIGAHEACLCGFAEMETGRQFVRAVSQVVPSMLPYGNKFCGPSGFLCRRDVLLQEQFDTSLEWGEDWDIYVRLSRRMPMVYCAKALFERRTSDPTSMTNKLKDMSMDYAEVMAGAIRKQKEWLGERVFLRRLADAYLTYIGRRPGKLKIIMQSARRAGWKATLWLLAYKVMDGHRRLVLDSRWNAEQASI